MNNPKYPGGGGWPPYSPTKLVKRKSLGFVQLKLGFGGHGDRDGDRDRDRGWGAGWGVGWGKEKEEKGEEDKRLVLVPNPQIQPQQHSPSRSHAYGKNGSGGGGRNMQMMYAGLGVGRATRALSACYVASVFDAVDMDERVNIHLRKVFTCTHSSLMSLSSQILSLLVESCSSH
jgi:hypothetical protein